MPRYKKCPRCHTPATIAARDCVECGHEYRTQFVPKDPTQGFGLGDVAAARAPALSSPASSVVKGRPYLVALMWLLTAACFALWNTSRTSALLLDVGAVCVALWLVTSRDREARVSGGLLLGAQAIALILASLGVFPPQPS